jgi:hypothetical protein
MSETQNKLFENWYKKFEPKKDKNKKIIIYKKQYLHFDNKIKNPSKNKAHFSVEILKKHKEIYQDFFNEYISKSDKVAKWEFLPFIKSELPKYKYINNKKDGTDKRPIMYCGHKDRLLYSYYSLVLEEKYEKLILNRGLEKSILAYRSIKKESGKGKSNLDFAKNAFDKIVKMKEETDTVALAFYIKGFFDNLNHNQLKHRWEDILGKGKLPDDHYKVFRSLTKFSFFQREELLRKVLKLSKPKLKYKDGKKDICYKWVTPGRRLINKTKNGRYNYSDLDHKNKWSEHFKKILCEAKKLDKDLLNRKQTGYSQKEKYIFETRKKSKMGIPQGSPISGTLSNIYMLKFDQVVKKEVEKLNGFYYRYSDDLLIILPKKKSFKIEEFVKKEIEKLELKIKDKKTIRAIFPKKTNTCYFINEKIEVIKDKKGKLQYLGLDFNGNKTLLRSSSICKSINKNRYRIKNYKKYILKKYKTDKVYKKALYKKLTHLGSMNFYRYAVIRKIKDNLDTIFDFKTYKNFKKQLKKHQKIIFEKSNN